MPGHTIHFISKKNSKYLYLQDKLKIKMQYYTQKQCKKGGNFQKDIYRFDQVLLF
jgi:hypothetical protein